MKKFLLSVLLVFAFSGTAYPWGTSGGDGSDSGQLQETAVFFNNSGETLWTGAVVVLDLSGSGVTTGTTLGAYVTTTTVADSNLVMGVVKVASNDQTPVVVVTKGPVDTSFYGSTDPLTGDEATGRLVGTTTKAGYAGGGTNLGVALENPAGTDSDEIYIWVNPTNSQ